MKIKKIRKVGDFVKSKGQIYKIIYIDNNRSTVGLIDTSTKQEYQDSLENLRNNYED